MSRKLSGRCLCGGVTFTAEPESALHACHCSQCRRFSGGVFMVADCGQTVQIMNGGDLATFYGSSEWGERGFCNRCGASLFWRSKADGRTYASIQTFENPGDFDFTTEIYVDSKPANYAFANHTVKLTGTEFLASFAEKQGSST
jgi:hypothetical protein